MKKNSLGRGLDVLFEENVGEIKENVSIVAADRVLPDKNQHRKTFHDDTIRELADSIRVHGILSPLIVRRQKTGDADFIIIAGERRYRAAKLLGLKELPVIVKDVSERDAAEIALIENLQREDLNPVDEAMGYDRLIREFGITQEAAAERVGKSRPAIANSLRLLNLPPRALDYLKRSLISAGHARALLALSDGENIDEMLDRIVNEGLSVRDTESEVRWLVGNVEETGGQKAPPDHPEKPPVSVHAAYLNNVENKASEYLSRRLRIKQKPGKPSGRLTIDYLDNDDLEDLLKRLCGDDFLDRLE